MPDPVFLRGTGVAHRREMKTLPLRSANIARSADQLSPVEAVKGPSISSDRYLAPLNGQEAAKVIGGATARQNAAASHSADLVFEALNGGVWGLGVDKPKLFAAVEASLASGGMELVRAHYRAHYGLSLEDDLLGQLHGQSKARASAMLMEQADKADATALRQALSGVLSNSTVAFEILERAAQSGRSKELRAALDALFPGQCYQLLARLPFHELQRAEALLGGDALAAHAHQISSLLDHTPAGRVRDSVLMRLLRQGGEALERRFAEVRTTESGAPASLTATLNDRLKDDPLLLAQATAALNKDDVAVRAISLGRTIRGASGFDVIDVAEAMLSGADPKVRQQIQEKYQQVFGAEIEADTRANRPMAAAAVSEVLRSGNLSLVSRLQAAVHHPQMLIALLEAVGPLAAQAAQGFEQRTGKSLLEASSEIDGLDKLRLSLAMKGPPKSLDEALDRLRAERDLVRAGLSNGGSRIMIDWLLLSRVGRVDETIARAEAALREAKADGTITKEEAAQITTLIRYGEADVGAYRDAISRVARVTKTFAGTLAASAALTATNGVGSSMVVKMASAALAGGAATSATDAVLSGRVFTLQRLREDFGMGALTGATLFAAQGLVDEIVKQGAEAYGTYFANAHQVPPAEANETYKLLAADFAMNSFPLYSFAAELGIGTARGAVGFSMSEAIRAAVREGNWDRGSGEGLHNVLTAAYGGLKEGAFNGAAATLLGIAIGGIQRVSLLPDYQAQELVHHVEINTPSGPHPMEIIGPGDDVHIKELTSGLQKLSDQTGGAGVQGLDIVYVLNTQSGNYAGVAMGEHNFAVSFENTFISHRRGAPSNLDEVVFHEDGHRLDAQVRGSQSALPSVPGHFQTLLGGSPFGQPPHLSDYAKTNMLEDLAVTHEQMISSLARSGEIDLGEEYAPKVRWILDHFYPNLDVTAK